MSLISEKTRKFLRGRRGLQARIAAACAGMSDIVWVHSPSYGEFEEARPVLAALRAAHPEYKFLVTFFSPSGYEYLKDDPACDFVFYLPLDGFFAARRFLDAVRPVKAVFCIADFWLFYLNELRRRGVPTYLVSARFNAGMTYFKFFGRPYLRAFRRCFTRIFVSNVESLEVLRAHGVCNCALMGDPRMDRVLALAAEEWSDPVVSAWVAGSGSGSGVGSGACCGSGSVSGSCCGSGAKVFVAGSVLLDMDAVLVSSLANAHPSDKFLVVPHEVDRASVESLAGMFEGRVMLYSEAASSLAGGAFAPAGASASAGASVSISSLVGGAVPSSSSEAGFSEPSELISRLGAAQVLIVDVVGLLSRLYRYGFMAYVGAGFDGAPHSVIEPAAYGIPVCFGPEFGPVWHCQKMIDAGAAFCVRSVEDLERLYATLSAPSAPTPSNPLPSVEGSAVSPVNLPPAVEGCALRKAGEAARAYCVAGSGAAAKIAKIID